MHRWFRFCAVIALTGFATSPLAQSAPSPTPKEAASGDEVPISKHSLKATPTQVLQHTVEQQGKQLEQFGAQIEAQTKQIDAGNKQLEELAKRAELQSKQIETLNADLNRLTTVLLARAAEQHTAPAATTPQPHASVPTVQTGPPTPEPPVAKAEPAPTEPEPTTAPDGTPTHVVKRGENLISIARQHGTTVSELLKLNKIEDERKLQIGQTLLLPKPTSPPQP